MQSKSNNPNAKNKPKKDAQFYPDEPDDGRSRGDWRTRYPDPQSQKGIRNEAIYLFSLLVIYFILFMLIISDVFFSRYFGTFLAGSVGGILYDLKWLIHTVGHGTWNEDRRLWRIITPHSSGVLSVFVIIIFSSGLFGLIDTSLFNDSILVFAVAFLSGYFSDYVISRLQDLISSVFGNSHTKDNSNQTSHSND